MASRGTSTRAFGSRSLLFATLALLIAGGGALLWFRGAAHKPADLRIYFTCDIRGRLVPCGCFTGQLGGLTRIGTMIGGGNNDATIRVDVGDALEGTADYQRIEHRYIFEAFRQLGYDAANLGHREAALSAAQLRELKTAGAVPFVSANLLDAQTRQPILATHRFVTRQGRRIAIVGVMDSRIPGENLGEGLAVEKMETTLANLLPTLRAKADAIVLLAFADEATLHALARDFYEIDVILGGKVSQPAQQLEKENRSLILYTTNQSRALGTLDVRFAGPKRIVPGNGEVQLVRDTIPEDSAIRKLAADYRAEIRRTKLDVDDPAKLEADIVPGVKAASGFAGSESCLGCHASAAEAWKSSQHAHAFVSLAAADADADPNCLACHTVGFAMPGGYRREFGDTRFTDVGCESCHGPGAEHVAQRQRGVTAAAKFRPLGSGDCVKCHHGEFSRPFDFEKMWPLVRHGK